MVSANTIRRISAIIFFLLVVIVGVVVVPFGPNADSADNYLGGCLITQGQLPYSDFVSQHNPLMYYIVAGIYTILGSCDITLPRYIFYALFIGILLLFRRYTQSYKIPITILLAYALLSPHYSYNLVLVDTWGSFAALVAFLLLWFHKKMSRRTFWFLFTAAQFSFLSSNPLYAPVAIVLMLFFLRQKMYSKLTVVLATLIPTILLFTHINVRDYIENVILFNFRQYPQCMGTFDSLYIHYFAPLKNFDLFNYKTAGVVFEIVVWIVLLLLGYRKWRSDKSITVIYGIVISGLFFVRPDGFHLAPFVLFSLAQIIYYAGSYTPLLPLAVLVLWASATNYTAMMQMKDTDTSLYTQLVSQYTREGDSILIYPGRAQVYIATDRMPGSYYNYFGACLGSAAENRVQTDIEKNKVSLVIIDNKHNAFGKGLPSQYMQVVIQFLESSPNYKTQQVDEYITIYRRIL